jgi:hypothetical protein
VCLSWYYPISFTNNNNSWNTSSSSYAENPYYKYYITTDNNIKYYAKWTESDSNYQLTNQDLSNLHSSTTDHFFEKVEENEDYNANYIYFQKTNTRLMWTFYYNNNNEFIYSNQSFNIQTTPFYLIDTGNTTYNLSGVVGYIPGKSNDSITHNLGMRTFSNNTALILETLGTDSNIRLTSKDGRIYL